MDILIVFLFVVISSIIGVVLLLRSGAALIKVAAKAQSEDDGPHLTGFNLFVQHNAPATALESMLKPLITVDPNFSSSSFLAQATDAFARVAGFDGSSSATDLPVTNLMLSSMTQVAESPLGSGMHTAAKDVRIDTSDIEAVRVDARRQAIDVIFRGTWTAGGATSPVPFARRASFVRPIGATSASASGSGSAWSLAEKSHCPHCGADVPTGAAACPFCGTQLDQTAVLWLLDSVAVLPLQTPSAVQQNLLKASASLGLVLTATKTGDPGQTTLAFGKNLPAAVDRIRQHDPNFTLPRFMRFATQEYLRRKREGDSTAITVQKADLFGVMADANKENIIVLISSLASGNQHLIEGAVFTRPAGSTTPPQPTAAPNALCTECGAPLTAGDTACRYCNAPIPDTEGFWKLEKFGADGATLAGS